MPRSLRSLEGTPPSLILTLCVLLLIPLDTQAQKPPPGLVEVQDSRRGFWLGLGLGAGGESNDFVAGSGYSDVFYQPTLSLKAGGTLGPHWRLGGEILAWINEEPHAVESLSSAMFVAQFYPIRTTGLYLKGGVGLGRNAVDFDDGFNVGDTGFAGLIGAGYELRVGRQVYLNPVVDLVGHRYDGRAGGSYRERLINFGVGVVFQAGR
jgi:Outer membrane protein beta-barrel domain